MKYNREKVMLLKSLVFQFFMPSPLIKFFTVTIGSAILHLFDALCISSEVQTYFMCIVLILLSTEKYRNCTSRCQQFCSLASLPLRVSARDYQFKLIFFFLLVLQEKIIFVWIFDSCLISEVRKSAYLFCHLCFFPYKLLILVHCAFFC